MESGNKALKYLIKAAPSGEMQDVLHHLATLAGSMEAISENEELVATLRKYYETHRAHVDLGDGKIGMVCAAGTAGSADNGDFLYYDNVKQCTFSFNPITLKGEIAMDEALPVPTSDFRESLVTALDAYS